MDSRCVCDSSEGSTDPPTDYLDALKKKYLDRTSKLQLQQQELEKRIMQMEIFLDDHENNDNSGNSTCSCDTRAVPKVFPEAPVRDVPDINVLSPIMPEQRPVAQTCSFFQKIMDNARSILSIKCQCASAFVSAKSTSITPKDGGTTSDFSPTSDHPTREIDFSTPQDAIEDETTATDHSSKTSICTCDDSNSTLMEVSCSCHLESQKVQRGQQVSNDASSSTHPKSQGPNSNKSTAGGRSAPSKDCSFSTKNNTVSDMTSSCSCEVCVCSLSDKIINFEPNQSQTLAIPKITVFSGKGDNITNAEVQATKPVQSKGLNIQVPKASKCVTCCRNQACASLRNRKDVGDNNISAGVQAASSIQSRGVNISVPKESFNVAVACCKSMQCPRNQNPQLTEKGCGGSCNLLPVDQAGETNQVTAQAAQNQVGGTEEIFFDACFEKCEATRQDGQNQCAFVGSPLLTPMSFAAGEVLTAQSKDPKQTYNNSVFSLTSHDILEMKNIADLAQKEKQMKAQIQELQKREQQYQEVTKNMNTLVSQSTDECCGCSTEPQSTNGMQQQIQKISQELRLENQYLKTELMDLKVELKHCLEKVEGPMKQKLQTEKQKCELLQTELQQASKNMLLSQDAYSREMNQLKLQLCCACSNITELNQMNGRLRDEMSHLDCLCAKLEDDLVKQKINEADTIKRLTSRRLSGDGPLLQSSDDLGNANLDSIARKLSKTLKELAPCNECSTLPPELAGAAKCIKELTDLVRKRRTKSSTSGGCCCAKQPSKQVSEEECCTCCAGPTDRGDKRETIKLRKKATASSLPCGCTRQTKPVSKPSSKSFLQEEKVLCSCTYSTKDGGGDLSGTKTPEEKSVRTLLPVPESFVQKGASSKFNVDVAASSYYSTNGEPTRDNAGRPCAKIGSPCLESKGTVTQKDDISRPELPPTEKPRQDQSLMCGGLETKGTVTSKEDVIRTDIVTDIQKQDVALDASSKKSLPCSNIEEPCQKESGPKDAGSGLTGDIPKEEVPKEGIPTEEIPTEKIPTEEIATENVQKENISSEKESDKSSPCSKIGEPCQTDQKANADVTTETKVPTAEKGCKAPCHLAMKSNDAGSEMDDIRKATPSDINDIANISRNIIDGLPISEDSKQPSSTGKRIREKRSLGEDDYEGDADDEEYDEAQGEPGSKERPESALREIPIDIERVGEFTVDVEMKAYALDEPPDGLHVTTTVTESGALAVITEGPGGTIETTMTYTDEGNIEVVTEMVEYDDQKSGPTEQALEKFRTEPPSRVPGVPEETSSMEKMSSTVVGGEPPISDLGAKPKLQPILPVASSKFSGPSGPETETPYTPSTASGEGALTSKLATESSGIKAALDITPASGTMSEETDEKTISKDEDMKTPGVLMSAYAAKVSEQPLVETVSATSSGIRVVKSGVGTTPSAQEAIRQDVGPDALLSEGVTSTGVDMPSGEVFTPDQAISDVEEDPMREQSQTVPSLIPPELQVNEAGAPTLAPSEIIRGVPSATGSRATTPKSVEFGEAAETSVRTAVDLETGLPKAASIGTETTSKKSEPTLDEKRLPGTSSTGPSSTRDCSCQSKDQKDQSCQCCECKTVGVTTSGDKETITAEEEMCKTQVDGAKTDTDSEFVTTSEITDNAFAQRPDKTKKTGEASISGIPLVVDDNMLKEHPELEGKTAEEQEEILSKLGYVTSQGTGLQNLLEQHPELKGKSSETIKQFLEKKGYSKSLLNQIMTGELTEEEIAKHPELSTMSKTEQRDFIKRIGSYVPSEIVLDDEMLKKHPELIGISKQEQQKILSDLGYKSSTIMEDKIVDESMLEKQLFGKNSEEQQEILKSLGYAPSKLSQAGRIEVDEKVLEKHPELLGKNSEEQQEILKSLGYAPSKLSQAGRIEVDEKVLEKHPELLGKNSEEQQEILKSLGYAPSKLSQAGRIEVDEKVLEKHPELLGKNSEEQQEILKSLGYAPSKLSQAGRIEVDEKVLEKHPELLGKNSEEQQEILKSLGYAPSKLSQAGRIEVDEKVLEMHPELVGKSDEEQQRILKAAGYVASAKQSVVSEEILKKHPELAGKSSVEQQQMLKKLGYATPSTALMNIDESMLEEHPELVGKTSEQQKQILKNLGYVTPGTASIVIDQSMLEKHPELVGKNSEQQRQILKNLGYVTPGTASIVVDQSMLEKHPELVGKTSEQQGQILKNLGYVTPGTASTVIDQSMLGKHPELVGKTSKQQEEILKSLGYKTPKAISTIDTDIIKKHPELAGKSIEQQREILENLGYQTPTASAINVEKGILNKPSNLPSTSSEQQQYLTPTASVVVDEKMLYKHPELVGKSSEQQQQLLASLGYVTPKDSSIIDKDVSKKESDRDTLPKANLKFATPEATSIIIDQEMLMKYPELAGKSPDQQQRILENLGFVTPPTGSLIIDQQLLQKHPDLAGKTPEEQKRILADSESVVMDDKMLKKHPELEGKTPEEQQKILANLGYKPEAGTKPILKVQEDESVIKIEKPRPSSKEISISCKASCRSAATIHDDSKSSEREITIGDASYASRSISLQQKPSSRDDSSSCKASCRTISIQSSSVKTRKDVEILEAARIGSSSTTSSSDSREKEKEKEKTKKKEKLKNKPGEVPSIVSQLSDKERPVIEPTKKTRGQRKKRSARLIPDCLKCSCKDPCICEVCSPDDKRHQRKVNRPVRSCDCPSPPVQPTIPTASSMPVPSPSHAPACGCNQCIFNPFTCHPGLEGRSLEGESPTSDENDSKKLRRHSSKCECVDCLCLPKIKKLAETREYPVVYDRKQIYHVKTNCGTCENAQSARRYVEQQRSRIPISTSTPNPPRAKPDSKAAASSSKVNAPKSSKPEIPSGPVQAGQLSQSDSIYNSICCDCEDCTCADCPDPKRKKHEKSDKDCCCDGPCVCKPCTMEELTKKLQEAQQKLAAATQAATQAASSAPVSGGPAPRALSHDEDCTCIECKCPNSQLMTGKEGSASAPTQTAATRPSEECTCPECVTCPQSELMQKERGDVCGKPSDNGDEEEECTCPECVCPGESETSQPPMCGPSVIIQDGSSKNQGHPPDCDCPECSCPGIGDFKKGAGSSSQTSPSTAFTAKAQGMAGEVPEDCDCTVCACPGKTSLPPVGGVGMEDCDCKDCVCSPCADIKKHTGKATPMIGDIPSGLANCDCVDCKCSPCADPKRGKGGLKPFTAEIKPGEKVLHPADCDCDECLCLEEIIKTELGKEHPADCDCPVCTCQGAGDTPGIGMQTTGIKGLIDKAVHPADCDCDECKCPGLVVHPADCDCEECKCPGLVGKVDKAVHPGDCDCDECKCPSVDGVVDKAAHPADCDCDECTCPGLGIAKQSAKVDRAVHPDDCDCDECKCPSVVEKAVHTLECDCDECKCPGSVEQATHALTCACTECLCPECTVQAEHAPGCRCDECICQECDFKSAADAGISTFTTGVSAMADVHPGDCSCIKCVCDRCSDPSKQKVAVQAGHAEGCKCVECLCKECLMKLEPLKHEEGCKCTQCTCVECLRKMSTGDQLGKDTQEGVEGRTAETGALRGDNCVCEHCMCIDCGKKPEGISAQSAGIGSPLKQEKCTCVMCDCNPCPTKDEAEKPCTCSVCTCLDCTKKPGIGAQTVGVGGDSLRPTHDDTCTCALCQCDPCPTKESEKPCTCPVCTCIDCTKKRGVSPQTAGIGGDGLRSTHDDKCTCELCQCDPCASKEAEKPCTCEVCSCVECRKKRDVGMGERDIGMGDKETHSPDCDCSVCQCTDDLPVQQPPERDGCTCAPVCTCESLEDTKESVGAKEPKGIAMQAGETKGMIMNFVDPPPFELPQRINCDCNKCECVICATTKGGPTLIRAQGGAIGPGGLHDEPPPFEVPVRIDCTCKRCDCVFCNKHGVKTKEMAAQQSTFGPNEQAAITGRTVSVQPSKFVDKQESKKQIQPSAHAAGSAMPIHCDCPTCTCNEGEIKTTMFTSEIKTPLGQKSAQGVGSQYLSIDTVEEPKPTLDAHMTKLHPTPCDCPECRCIPCSDPAAQFTGAPIQAQNVKIQESVKRMDNVTLARSIQAANKENCECKEQIEEIKKTLERIKCACTEAEFRSSQSVAQQMGTASEIVPGKPFVKQASVFGQTMSGLKMALANLQAKCKAKDKMIEAMTGELEIRGDPSVFDKVYDRTQKPVTALDYDQAEDVKSMEISKLTTNIIYGKTTADQSTAPCDLRCVASKGVEVRTHKHKKKKDRDGSGKKLDDCSCSKPQITQKEEKDCQKLDLSGFEVIDIRRITDDSLIVKWNSPKCKQVAGYDIFVNGTLSSKVMSGSRTSAMMHSLDLSKSVQITIYAVSKCGRIEPPAIAIYEIKS